MASILPAFTAEPTGAVDTETAQGLIRLLKELNREQEVTVII